MPKKRQSKRKQSGRRRPQSGGGLLGPGPLDGVDFGAIRRSGIVGTAIDMLKLRPTATRLLRGLAGQMGGLGKARRAPAPPVGASGMKI